MHHVSTIDRASTKPPEAYRQHSTGFRRATYVEHGMGSVHMGAGICFLDSSGTVEPHIHAFEETFIILEGCVMLQMDDQVYALKAGHYGLIATGTRHGWHCNGDEAARWLEMQAPQPRPADYGRDTFFIGDKVPAQAAPPDSAPEVIGFFDETELSDPGAASQMEGLTTPTGVTIKMFVDRSFGAVHQSLFLIQYMPGAKIDPHDHSFEESYFIVSGQVEAIADGKTYLLGPGDAIWTSVGCIHSFANVGSEPVRWLETQAPLPPTKEAFRFERDWTQYIQASG